MSHLGGLGSLTVGFRFGDDSVLASTTSASGAGCSDSSSSSAIMKWDPAKPEIRKLIWLLTYLSFLSYFLTRWLKVDKNSQKMFYLWKTWLRSLEERGMVAFTVQTNKKQIEGRIDNIYNRRPSLSHRCLPTPSQNYFHPKKSSHVYYLKDSSFRRVPESRLRRPEFSRTGPRTVAGWCCGACWGGGQCSSGCASPRRDRLRRRSTRCGSHSHRTGKKFIISITKSIF